MSIMLEPFFDYQFRLVLIGSKAVGKSSLLTYFTDGKFNEVSDSTVGVDFSHRIIELENGAGIKLQLWDTAGEEKFKAITKLYYRNAVGVLLVYDVCDRASFEDIPRWIMEARLYTEPRQPVFVLVGCKLDLIESSVRKVGVDEANAFAKKNNMTHVVTSAKTGLNVRDVFVTIAQEVYNKIQSGEYTVEEDWHGIKLGFPRPDTNKGFKVPQAELKNITCSC